MAALKFLSEQHLGNVDQWYTLAQKSAASFVQARMNPAGLHQGYPSTHRMSSDAVNEDAILKELKLMEAEPCQSGFAARMLSLACSTGMHRVVSALLAQGASVEDRDQAGFTPLMHAAVRGQVKVFQLLLTRGADASVRNLQGHTAIDLAGSEIRDQLLHVLESTQRRRHSRPTLHSRLSYTSTASSKASWDIASASFYESEVESNESQPASRRPSTWSLIEEEEPASTDGVTPPSPCAAMAAWRDALAAQMHHFQETVHWNMPHFQLPPLPNLTDCRRLSSLVPSKSGSAATERQSLASQQQPLTRHHFWDFFSASSDTPESAPTEGSAPPAYHDIFPDRKVTQGQQQDDGARTAVVDAVADEKCAAIFDGHSEDVETSSTSSLLSAGHAPNKTDDGALMPSWLWVSSLCFRYRQPGCSFSADDDLQMPVLVVLGSVAMQSILPIVLAGASRTNSVSDTTPHTSPALMVA